MQRLWEPDMPYTEVMEILQEVEQEASEAKKQRVGKMDEQDFRFH